MDTESGSNGSAVMTTQQVDAGLAGGGPGRVLDLGAMVAKYVDGDWHDLPSGGRVKVRAPGLESYLFQQNLERVVRKELNLPPDAVFLPDGKVDPKTLIPDSNYTELWVRTMREHMLVDFDSFSLNGAPLPNRDPEHGAKGTRHEPGLHLRNLDLLLAINPVRMEIDALVKQIIGLNRAIAEIEEKNSPTPSPAS